jgi:CRISPR/Cas system CSM-associated protein Csm4 (group 5 of RAMP superfamily)
MKTLALKPIYSTEVLNVWPLVEGLITKSLKHADDKYSIYDIKYCLIKKEMQLWTIVDCSGNIKSTIVTSIADYPNKRVLFMR